MRIIWAPRALQRVAEAVEYIAHERPSVAVRWIDSLLARVELLAEQPLQGPQVFEGQRAELRQLLFGRHRVIYRVRGEEEIHILTVKHQRQLLDADDLKQLVAEYGVPDED